MKGGDDRVSRGFRGEEIAFHKYGKFEVLMSLYRPIRQEEL
jgi:hypothetical protein